MNRYSVPTTASLERLDCYRVARDFARLAQRLPIANAVLRDQWRRASISVLTNVAEGAGRVAKADKQTSLLREFREQSARKPVA